MTHTLDTLPMTSDTGRREIAFILDNVTDWQTLARGLPSGMEVVVIDGQRDGLAQIAAHLANQAPGSVDAIHLLSHGSSGAIDLGALTLSSANLDQHTEMLSRIGRALTAEGDWLVYGCNVAEGQVGLDFVGKLAQTTGADVAASDDLTGAAGLEGDWVLERVAGDLETSSASTSLFDGALAIVTGYIAAASSRTLAGYTWNWSMGNGSGEPTATPVRLNTGQFGSGASGVNDAELLFGTAVNNNGTGAGEQFVVYATDGKDFKIKSFQVITGIGSAEISIVGYKDGSQVYTDSKIFSEDGLMNGAETYSFSGGGVSVDKLVITHVDNFQYDDATSLFNFLVDYDDAPASDIVPPTLDGPHSTPADNATNVAIGDNLVIDFSENIAFGASGIITLRNVTANSTAETFDVSTVSGGTVTGSAGSTLSISNDKLTLNPNGNLKAGTAYSVQFSASSIVDTAGTPNPLAAITDDSTYNVTTAAPTVTLSVDSASVAEAAGTRTITATLSAATSADTTVAIGRKNTSTAALTDDFTVSPTTITIAAGQTTGTATLTAVQDTLDEEDETAIIEITGVSGGGGATESGTQEITVSITDDDAAPSLSVANASLTEGNSGSSNMSFTVTLNAASGRTVTVDYTTSDNASATAGTDYTATTGTLTFNPGETSKTFTVPVLGDTTQESNETFTVTLSNAGNATLGTSTATGTISNDENTAPVLDLNGSVTAGTGNTVTLANAATGLAAASALASDTELGSTNWNGGSLSVQRIKTGGTADGSAHDVFSFTAGGAFTATGGAISQGSNSNGALTTSPGGTQFATWTYTSATGKLDISFDANASSALVQDVVCHIGYSNATPYGDATIRMTLSDGTTPTTADVLVTSSTIHVNQTTLDTDGDAADGFNLAEALAVARHGDSILIHDGTYRGQFNVTKAVTIDAQGGASGNVTIESPDSVNLQGVDPFQLIGNGRWRMPVVNVDTDAASGTVAIKNVTIDGRDQAVVDEHNGNKDFLGIAVVDSHALIDNVTIKNIRSPQGSNQWGFSENYGILAEAGSALGQTMNVTIKNSTVFNYQKTGIVAWGPKLNMTITDNDITGMGVLGASGQNGMQIGSSNADRQGTTATISGNTISNLSFDNNVYGATGIILRQTGNISATGNAISGPSDGIGNVAGISIYQGLADKVFSFSGNTFVDTDYAIFNEYALGTFTLNIGANNFNQSRIAVLDSDVDDTTYVNTGTQLTLNSTGTPAGDALKYYLFDGPDSFTDTGSVKSAVYGGSGNESISTGSGNDTLVGGLGNDTLTGGQGADVFLYSSQEVATELEDYVMHTDITDFGIDRITDFGTGDAIRVIGRQSTSGTVTTGNGTSVAANSVQASTTAGVTTLYIDSDATTDTPELLIELTGTYLPENFVLDGEYIRYQGSPPTVTSVVRQTPASTPTNADSITWRVTFNEAVSNIDTADFAVSGTTGTVSAVTQVGTSNAYDVTVSDGDLVNYNGTVTLSLAGGQNIQNASTVTLASLDPTGTDDERDYVLDNTLPSITLTTTSIPNTGNVTVRSSETGTVYLVKNTVTVNSLTDITSAPDGEWNSVSITAADTDTALAATGLGDGTYVAYALDAAGNLSVVSTTNVKVDGTAPTFSAATGTPADNATNVARSQTLTLKFSEGLHGTSCNLDKVYLKDVVTDTPVPATITINGNGELVIDPTDNLAYSTSYYVTWEEAALKDAAGNAAAAVSDETTFNFTTEAVPLPPAPSPTPESPTVPSPSDPVSPSVPESPGPSGTPVGTYDGITINGSTQTSSNGTTVTTISVPIVQPTRQDQPGTTNTTHADIPLAQGSNGERLIEVSVPTGVGLTAQTLQGTNKGLREILIEATQPRVNQQNTFSELLGAGIDLYVPGVPDEQQVTVRTVTLTAGSSTTAPTLPIIITGANGTGENSTQHPSRQEALVIDARQLPPGSLLQLDNVEFAIVIGATRVIGGSGRNFAVGDDAQQYFVLGADDDLLRGGGGNDVVGSRGGNDELFGDAGDDRLFGGIGDDTLQGGTGNDVLQGGSSDAGQWTIALDSQGLMHLKFVADEVALAEVTNTEVVWNWSQPAELRGQVDGRVSILEQDYARLSEFALLYRAVTGERPDAAWLEATASGHWSTDGLAQLAYDYYLAQLGPHAQGLEVQMRALITKVWGAATEAEVNAGIQFLEAGGQWAEGLKLLALSDRAKTLMHDAAGNLQLTKPFALGEVGWVPGSGNDQLMGGEGQDLLVGGGGNNLLDGGAGIDMASFVGAILDYQLGLKETSPGTVDLVVRNIKTGDESILRNIELAQFGDLIYRGKTNPSIPLQQGHFESASVYVELVGQQALQEMGVPAGWG